VRDIQLQSGKAISEVLMPKIPRREDLFCDACAEEALFQLHNLRGIKAEKFEMAVCCCVMRCDRCNRKTSVLSQIRVEREEA
jgi:hypothetical protein